MPAYFDNICQTKNEQKSHPVLQLSGISFSATTS